MRTPEQVAAIEQPMPRLKAAAALLRQLEARADRRRADRAAAVISAHLHDGVKRVAIYRDTLHMSRGLCNRIIDRAPADWKVVRDALPKAVKAHADVLELVALIEQVLEIRDTTALMLMDGGYGSPVPNADVARATGLSTARISQMRTGAQ